MNGDRSISLFISIVLLTQVGLSLLIVGKIGELNKTIHENFSSAAFSGNEPLDLPEYVSDVSIDDDPWLGNPDAEIVVVEFSDFECPFCAQSADIVDQLLNEYPDQVLFVYRDFPLTEIHPNAFHAAEAANCAKEQSLFWEMHDVLFENHENLDFSMMSTYAGESGLDIAEFQ